MADYIEREKVLSKAAPVAGCFSNMISAYDVIMLPADDVAPVVRCRDCKYHHWEQEPCHGKTVHYCELPHMRGVEVFEEFFCYYGKRKGDSE